MKGKIARSKKDNIFGYHLMLDLYDCDPQKINDIHFCYSYLDSLPDLLGLEKFSPPYIIFTDDKKYPDKAGLSGWVPFLDPERKLFSGASIHTLTPTRFISVDIYGNKKFDQKKVQKFTQRIFGAGKPEKQTLVRGKRINF